METKIKWNKWEINNKQQLVKESHKQCNLHSVQDINRKRFETQDMVQSVSTCEKRKIHWGHVTKCWSLYVKRYKLSNKQKKRKENDMSKFVHYSRLNILPGFGQSSQNAQSLLSFLLQTISKSFSNRQSFCIGRIKTESLVLTLTVRTIPSGPG